MIRERFTSSLKTCWRLPTLFVPNRIMLILTSYECQAYSQHAFNVGALRMMPTIWRLHWGGFLIIY